MTFENQAPCLKQFKREDKMRVTCVSERDYHRVNIYTEDESEHLCRMISEAWKAAKVYCRGVVSRRQRGWLWKLSCFYGVVKVLLCLI